MYEKKLDNSLNTIKKNTDFSMFRKSGTAFFWEKTAPAAISKVGTKLLIIH